MEKLYSFQGGQYGLEEVAQEVDKALQNMINNLADMQSLYKSVISRFKVEKLDGADEVTDQCLKLFSAFKAKVEQDHERNVSSIKEIIENDDYQNMLERVEKTVERMEVAIEGLDKTLQDAIDSKIDKVLRYETLCQNKDSIRFALNELQLEQDYTRQYAAERENDMGEY